MITEFSWTEVARGIVTDKFNTAKEAVMNNKGRVAAAAVAVPSAIFATVVGAREVSSYRATGSMTPKMKRSIQLLQKGFQAAKNVDPTTRNAVLAGTALVVVLLAGVMLIENHFSKIDFRNDMPSK
ncbi:MAG: hypothetical protein SNF33_07895 [Candidatus Algichlamydia australiensis]|nr:hypothetical protein [Chlamydiales bacterium]